MASLVLPPPLAASAVAVGPFPVGDGSDTRRQLVRGDPCVAVRGRAQSCILLFSASFFAADPAGHLRCSEIFFH